MKESILSYIEKLKTNRKQRHKLLLIFCTLAMFVAGGVFWRLRLIGITKTASPMCGIEEHVHTDECIVSKVLICGYDSLEDEPADPGEAQKELYCEYANTMHTHTPECYAADGTLTCGYADFIIHHHNQYCFDSNGNLVCTLPEISEHYHDTNCYHENTVFLCDGTLSSEMPLHIHDDSCYTTESILICELPEDENHTHDQNCYKNAEILSCMISDTLPDMQAEHIHTEECPTSTERTLVCTQKEAIAHIHTNECFDANNNLICGMLQVISHQHDESCWRIKGESTDTAPLSCTFAGHQHDQSCYDAEGNKTCGFADYVIHYHTADCYDAGGNLVCLMPEVKPHTHTDECYNESLVWSCGLNEGDLAVSHIHTEGCYDADNQLICTVPETEPHVHGDSCILNMQRVLICGEEEICEHIHTQDCYDENGLLVCGLDITLAHQHDASCRMGYPDNGFIPEIGFLSEFDPGFQSDAPVQDPFGDIDQPEEEAPKHVHTDECYQIIYGCGFEQHVHSIMCYADINADVETLDYWKQTLPKKLSEFRDESVVKVALSQCGYRESKRNFTLDDQGVRRGYSRYGAWYGNPYGEWNSMFVAFCLNYGGVSQEDIPYNSGAYAWAAELKEKELFVPIDGEYIALPGDIIFYDTDEDGTADRVGIVYDITDDGFIAIEGDYCDGDVSEPYISDSIIQSVINEKYGDEVVHLGEELFPEPAGDFEFGFQPLSETPAEDQPIDQPEDGEVLLDESKESYVWDDDNIPTHYVAQVTHNYSDGNILGYVRLAEEISEELSEENDLLMAIAKTFEPVDNYENLPLDKKYAIVNVDNDGNKNALTIANYDILTGTAATFIDESSTNNLPVWTIEESWREDLRHLKDSDGNYLGYNPEKQGITLSKDLNNDTVLRPNFSYSLKEDKIELSLNLWPENYPNNKLSVDSNGNFICSTNSTELTLTNPDGTKYIGNFAPGDQVCISYGGKYLSSNSSDLVAGAPAETVTTISGYNIGTLDYNDVSNSDNKANCSWKLKRLWENKYSFIVTLDGVTYYLSRGNDSKLGIGQLILINESTVNGSNTQQQDATKFVCELVDGTTNTVRFWAWGNGHADYHDPVHFKVNDDGTFNLVATQDEATKFTFGHDGNPYWTYDNLNNQALPSDPVTLNIGGNKSLSHIPVYTTTTTPGTPSYIVGMTPTTTTVKKLQNPQNYTKWTIKKQNLKDKTENGVVTGHFQTYNISSSGKYIELKVFDGGNDGSVGISNSAYELVIEYAEDVQHYRIRSDSWGRNYLMWDGNTFVPNHYQGYQVTWDYPDKNHASIKFYNTDGYLVEPVRVADGSLQLPEDDYIIIINDNTAVTLGSTGNYLSDAKFGSKRLEDIDLWKLEEFTNNGSRFDYRIKNLVESPELQYIQISQTGTEQESPTALTNHNYGDTGSKFTFVPYNNWNGNNGFLIMSMDSNNKDTPYYLVRHPDGKYYWQRFNLDNLKNNNNNPDNLNDGDKQTIAQAGGFFQLYQEKDNLDEEFEKNKKHTYTVSTGGGAPSKSEATPIKLVLKEGDQVELLLTEGESYLSIDGSNVSVRQIGNQGNVGNVDFKFFEMVPNNNIDKGDGNAKYHLKVNEGSQGHYMLEVANIKDPNTIIHIDLTVLDDTASDPDYYQELKESCGGKTYGNTDKSKRYHHLDVEIDAKFDINVYRPDGTVRKVKPENVRVTEVTATVYNTASLLGSNSAVWNEDYIFNRNVEEFGKGPLPESLQNNGWIYPVYINPLGEKVQSVIDSDAINPIRPSDKKINYMLEKIGWLKDGNVFAYNEAYMYTDDQKSVNDPRITAKYVDKYGNTQNIECYLSYDAVYNNYRFIEPTTTTVPFQNTVYPNNNQNVMSYKVNYNPGKTQQNGQFEFLTTGWGWLELYDGDTVILHATIAYDYNGKTYYSTQDVTRLVCDTTNICPSSYSADIPVQGFDIDVFMNDAEQFEATEFAKVDQYNNAIPEVEFEFYHSDSNYQIGNPLYTKEGKKFTKKGDKDNGTFHFTVEDVYDVFDGDGDNLRRILQREGATAIPTNKSEVIAKDLKVPLTLNQIYEFLGEYFVMKEVTVPNGYSTNFQQINMHFIGKPGDNDITSENTYLVCDNSDGFNVRAYSNAFITAPEKINGTSLINETYGSDGKPIYTMNGTLFAVVEKWENNNWIPLQDYRYEFKPDQFVNGTATVTAKNLPGDIQDYQHYIDANDTRMPAQYRIKYLYYPPNSNASEVSSTEFTLNWSANVYITNIENRLFFKKVDSEDNPVNGAEFALYPSGTPVQGSDELNRVNDLKNSENDLSDVFTGAYYIGDDNATHGYLGDITKYDTEKGMARGDCIYYKDGTAHKGRFAIDYYHTRDVMPSGYVTKPYIGQIHIKNTDADSQDVTTIGAILRPDSTNAFVGYTHTCSPVNNECRECIEKYGADKMIGMGHFSKIPTGQYILREIQPPTGFAINNKAQIIINVDATNGVTAVDSDPSDNTVTVNQINDDVNSPDYKVCTVKVVDEIATYLTIVKRGDTDGDDNTTAADAYIDGAEFVLYKYFEEVQPDGSKKIVRKYYTEPTETQRWFEYEEDYSEGNVLYPKAKRFTTETDGAAKSRILLTFANSGKYYLEEVKAPAPYGLIGDLEIDVQLPKNEEQGKISIKGLYEDATIYPATIIPSDSPYHQSGDLATQYMLEILDPKTFRIEVEKVDANGGKALEGAKFRVYKCLNENGVSVKHYYESLGLNGEIVTTTDVTKAKEFESKYQTAAFNINGTTTTYYVTNHSIDQNVYADYNEPNRFYTITSTGNGTYTASQATYQDDGTYYKPAYFSIDGIANTDSEIYYIEEITPPLGYYPLAEAIEVDFKNQVNGKPAVTIEGNKLAPDSVQPINDPSNNSAVIGYKFKVSNSAGYELPETGGIGTHYYTFGGLLLMVIPLVYGFVRRRRERREVE